MNFAKKSRIIEVFEFLLLLMFENFQDFVAETLRHFKALIYRILKFGCGREIFGPFSAKAGNFWTVFCKGSLNLAFYGYFDVIIEVLHFGIQLFFIDVENVIT